jgi:hypothetical protein
MIPSSFIGILILFLLKTYESQGKRYKKRYSSPDTDHCLGELGMLTKSEAFYGLLFTSYAYLM